jgi:hypothetical protein
MSLTEKELTRLYRQFDAECGRLADKIRDARDYEPCLYVPTPAAREADLKSFAGLLERAGALPAPDPVLAILKNHFGEFIKGQVSTLESKYASPEQFVTGIIRFIDFMCRKDSRFAEDRSAIMLRRLGQLDGLWNGIRSILPTVAAGNLASLAAAARMLARVCGLKKGSVNEDFAGLPDADIRQIAAAFDGTAAEALGWAAEVEGSMAGAPTDVEVARPDVERYRTILAEERGVSLDDLVRWHAEEVEKTRSEMFQIAASLRLGAEPTPTDVQGVVAVLNKYAGPAATPEEMFSRCRDYLARARVAIKGYVNVPDEICRVVPMEEYGREQNPWGGYRGGCPRRRPLAGEMVLNDGNLGAITDGWIKINAVHESYPGHHVQFLRATVDPLPETIKMGARATPLIEGTCVRTERVFEFVFPEDQFYPLFTAYRRHHTSVRIKVDLYLHYFHRPVEDAVRLYMDELGFDRRSARGQVKAQELQPGYFTTYYYGLKRVLELQDELGYDEKSFTEMLFAAGRVSLKTFEDFLKLSEADRKRYLTGFESLLAY